MKLIVGLGNPTSKYRGTYHNLGFMVLDELSSLLGVKIKVKECKALTAKTSRSGDLVVLAKPQTFMNLSGECVKELAKKYGADSKDILVVFDDADIPLGKLRLRTEGSGGTHNGVKNIVSELNSQNFKRLRVGMKVQELEERTMDIGELVLSKIQYEDKETLENSVKRAAAAVLDYINGTDIEKIRLHLND